MVGLPGNVGVQDSMASVTLLLCFCAYRHHQNLPLMPCPDLIRYTAYATKLMASGC